VLEEDKYSFIITEDEMEEEILSLHWGGGGFPVFIPLSPIYLRLRNKERELFTGGLSRFVLNLPRYVLSWFFLLKRAHPSM